MIVSQVVTAFAFLTRLPVATHATTDASGSLVQALRWGPLVGMALGLVQWVVVAPLIVLQAPAFMVGLVAVMVTVWLSRGLHEDGLSDYVDGLAGGWTRERRLEIMKDSRIGAFGAVALVISIGLRSAAIASIAILGTWSMVLAMMLAGALSRSSFLFLFRLLPPARAEGLSAHVGLPGNRDMLIVLLQPLLLLMFVQPAAALAVLLAWALAVLLVVRQARVALGGHTGDVAGALQQITETVVLCVLSLGIWR